MLRFLTFTGWRRNLISCLFGLLLTGAFPPLFLTPLIVPAFTGLFLLLNSSGSPRRAFWDGWWFGLGFLTTSLYWICESMFVDIAQFWWAVPFALFGLPVMLAIYIGLFGIACHYAFTKIAKNTLFKLLWFAALWVGVEYARGHLFTGFPWNLAGYVWTVSDLTLQPAALFGVYGLSWLTALFGALPVIFILPSAHRKFCVKYSFLIIVTLLLWSYERLFNHPTQYTDVKLHVVQANIEQSLKYSPEDEQNNFNAHVALSKDSGADIIIWPEAALTLPIQVGESMKDLLAHIAPPKGLLIIGGDRIDKTANKWSVWNSMFAINEQGEIERFYDKRKLVPFGEYIPFRDYIPFKKLTHGFADFSAGTKTNMFSTANWPTFNALICYEAIFPDLAHGIADPDIHVSPSWILNITNDAWFGTSSGPYQHLNMARMRAVEQGMPLVRAANTGISAIIDAYGRILIKLPLETVGTIDSELPKPAEKTMYAKHEDRVIFSIIMFILLFCALSTQRRKV